jgi:hypothetical protein
MAERVAGAGLTCGGRARRKGQCIIALSVNTEGNCGIQSATKRNGFGHPILSLSHFSQSEPAPYDTRYQPIPNCSSVSLTHDYAKWVNGRQDRLHKLVRDYWD